MSRIDEAINEVWETSSELLANDARAELAQLRADLKAAQERISELIQDDRYCPLCTWRGPVELVNGVCPQCDVDWPKEYREHRDALIVAQERIAEQARQLDAARNCITRRLRYHRNYPPVNSARWTDRENGIPGEDARDCDCDYCIEDRAWLAANPAPQEPQQAKNQDDDYRDYEAENEEMLWTYHHDPDHGL